MNMKAVQFIRQYIKKEGGIESFIKHMMQRGQQNVHTPFSLCREIIEKLKDYTILDGKKIAILFNIEFLHVLVNDFGVKTDDIVMFADDDVEVEFCRLQYGMRPKINLFRLDAKIGRASCRERV